MEYSTHELAKLAGVTTRTLRHYDAIGILVPVRTGFNGSRWYDASSLVRLQQILLFRGLGLHLSVIHAMLDRQTDEEQALREHVELLREQRRHLTEQIASVECTLKSLARGEEPMAEHMFKGFDDHQVYAQEVAQRWGRDAYQRSDSWWRGKNDTERQKMASRVQQLNSDWISIADNPDVSAESSQAQEMARRHIAWITEIPGTPAYDSAAHQGAHGRSDNTGMAVKAERYIRGLAELYVEDERFAAQYGGIEGARFVRDALLHYVGHESSELR
ncbi:MAG: MerR family transcriptional regulator [Bifidobacterium crudilactis]|nr:MerR family transcriptional regulator [Bifidobacterium crudilactis]